MPTRSCCVGTNLKKGKPLPARGFPLENSPLDCFLTPSCAFGAKGFRALRGAPGVLPLDPTTF